MSQKTIFTIEKLYAAYKKSIKRKRSQLSAIEFSYSVENNLFQLLYALQNRTYTHNRFKCFVVTKPVIREVFCSQFKDRVVQHLLLTEIEPLFEPAFIYDSYACRKNKGTHLAIKRVQQAIQSSEDRYKKAALYLQIDISGFFMSIDKSKLYAITKKHLLDNYKKYGKSDEWLSEIVWLTEQIIFADPIKHHIKTGDLNLFKTVPPRKSLFANTQEGKGLPIGNLSSQFFANVYLNELDQFAKRTLKCSYYFRYVDDMVILHYDKNYLCELQEQINAFLQERLFIQLNKNKTHLQLCEKGIDFLGYIIRKKYILVRKRVVNNLKQKLWYYQRNKFSDLYALKNMNHTIRSYYGHFKHANSYRLVKSINEKMMG